MRNEGDGSNVARGRKKRRKLSPSTPEKPATAAQTMCLRNLLIGGSGSLATIGPAAGGFVTGFAAAFVTPALTAAVDVGTAFDETDSGTARTACGVPAGTSLPGTSPRGAASETVPDDAARAEGGTTVEGVEGDFDPFGFSSGASPSTTSPLDAARRSPTEARFAPQMSSP